MRLALAQPDGPAGEHAPPEAGPLRKVSEMARFAAENHAGPLRLADVARHVGLHPQYAMTLFRKHYGITRSPYVTRCASARLSPCSSPPTGTSRGSVFETAFGSISRFYEAFKAMTGRTPKQYRQLPKPS